jgi:hypothetical protein
MLIAKVLVVIILFIRFKVISSIAYIALQYGEEAKRTIKEKMNHSNLTAGKF